MLIITICEATINNLMVKSLNNLYKIICLNFIINNILLKKKIIICGTNLYCLVSCHL